MPKSIWHCYKLHDTVLGMSFMMGHLTHGAKVNFPARFITPFSTASTRIRVKLITIRVEALAKEHKPKMIIAGFSAYSQIVDWQRFRDIADMVGAYFVVDMAHVAGLVATGHYPNPVLIADVVTTTTHKTLRGPRGVNSGAG